MNRYSMACMYARMHESVCIYRYIYKYTYTHTNTHTHTHRERQGETEREMYTCNRCWPVTCSEVLVTKECWQHYRQTEIQ